MGRSIDVACRRSEGLGVAIPDGSLKLVDTGHDVTCLRGNSFGAVVDVMCCEPSHHQQQDYGYADHRDNTWPIVDAGDLWSVPEVPLPTDPPRDVRMRPEWEGGM